MSKRIAYLLGIVGLVVVVVVGCSVSPGGQGRITATPTKTRRPLFTATLTPTPTAIPSDTPLPTDTPAPTDTVPPPAEVPPTEAPPAEASPTVVPPTEAPPPTNTPPPPTEAPPPTQAPPANTPKPKPTNPPPPPTNTPKPQVDFRVKEIVAFEDGSLTASGLHNIYFTVVDAGGAPIDGIIIEEVNNQPATQVVSGDKGPGKSEYTMWATDYRFKVVGNNSGKGFSSETTHTLSVIFEHAEWEDLIRGGICGDAASCRAMGPIHYSYNVTFQRTW